MAALRAALTRRTHIVHSIDETDDPEDLDSPEDIETGKLSIQTQQTSNEKALQKGFWQRPAAHKIYQLPTDGTTLLSFEILTARVFPPDAEDPKVKRYVVYEITVRQDSSIIDPQPAIIERRYTDFRILYLNLKREFPSEITAIDFPSKVLIGNFAADLIAERSTAFESFLLYITSHHLLRESKSFLHFLQHKELTKACQYLDERRNECAIPILENCFSLLNKIFMDRSRAVLLILCRLVAACTSSPVPHHSAEHWASVALNRYDTLCDIDLLPLYIPLLHTCAHLWWQRGRDQKPITDRLTDMSKKGINTSNNITLMQAIHKLDPRTETI